MLLVASCLLVACNIDREPKGSMSSQRILEHPEEAIDGMTHGMYAQLKTWSDAMHRCGEYAGSSSPSTVPHRTTAYRPSGIIATRPSYKPPTSSTSMAPPPMPRSSLMSERLTSYVASSTSTS